MLLKKITNPIYKELKNLKIINNKDIEIINTQTRDRKINVYQDKKSKIIFLEKFYRDHDYIYSRVANEKYYKVKNSKIITKILNDDYRRSKQFQKFFYKKDILDFGCGFGNLFKFIKNPKTLSGIEVKKNYKIY